MADVRVKLGVPRDSKDIPYLPHEMSTDPWAEISKYQQEKDNESKR
jgi:hypothetical protein